ncbi:hypothetical protein [Ferrimonas aestuarii]|nr:hypothetical protein [Ferrimonas aestuarii]
MIVVTILGDGGEIAERVEIDDSTRLNSEEGEEVDLENAGV